MALSRRTFLGGALALGAGTAGCSGGAVAGQTDAVTAPAPVRIPYGEHPSQFGELHLPTGDRRPGVAVVVHGGFWRQTYGLDLGTPLAADLAARGRVSWNLEYRRVGRDGSRVPGDGGWPTTFADIAAGIDALRSIAASGEHGPIDLGHVVAIGHSAGGHLAAWAAGRRQLGSATPSSFGPSSVAVTAVVSQAGVVELARAQRDGLGDGAVVDLMGGDPAQVPERYHVADPAAHLPLGVPVHCVHGTDDDIVPIDQSEAYLADATAAGDRAVLHRVEGDHFVVIDVTSAAWRTVVDLLPQLLPG